jgi:hypothetical protein
MITATGSPARNAGLFLFGVGGAFEYPLLDTLSLVQREQPGRRHGCQSVLPLDPPHEPAQGRVSHNNDIKKSLVDADVARQVEIAGCRFRIVASGDGACNVEQRLDRLFVADVLIRKDDIVQGTDGVAVLARGEEKRRNDNGRQGDSMSGDESVHHSSVFEKTVLILI